MFGLSTLKLAIIGGIILAVLLYVGYLNVRITYLKAEIITYEAVIAAQDAKLTSLEDITKAQDKVRQEQSAAQAKEIFRLQNLRVKDIRELKSLKDIVIPDLARRVFNSTTETGRDETSTPGQADPGNAESSTTLADLLVTNETNKANYLSCRNASQGWQKLWKETEENLNGTP